MNNAKLYLPCCLATHTEKKDLERGQEVVFSMKDSFGKTYLYGENVFSEK